MRWVSLWSSVFGWLFSAGWVSGQTEPPAGYAWSAPLGKPPALVLNQRHAGGEQPGGYYDFCVTTVGDNWSISQPSGYGTVFIPPGGNVSVRYSAGFQEPSCGWIAWRRGPYASPEVPENQRGEWIVGQPENAGPFPHVSMPITTHHGGDFQRYLTNGWAWQKADFFQFEGMSGKFYRGSTPKAPLQLDGVTRPDLPNPPPYAPDLTLLCAVSNATAHQVSICWVDQFGRESPLSDKLACPPLPNILHGIALVEHDDRRRWSEFGG